MYHRGIINFLKIMITRLGFLICLSYKFQQHSNSILFVQSCLLLLASTVSHAALPTRAKYPARRQQPNKNLVRETAQYFLEQNSCHSLYCCSCYYHWVAIASPPKLEFIRPNKYTVVCELSKGFSRREREFL